MRISFDITLDEADEPIIKFTTTNTEKSLDEKMLGLLLRKISKKGIQLHLAKTYPDQDEVTIYYDYHIRATGPDTHHEHGTESDE